MNPLLKISVIDTPTEQKLVLEGELGGSCLVELQRVWGELRHQRSKRACIVDLSATTVIRDDACLLLSTMIADGAKLVVAGVLNKHIVTSLKRKCRTVSTGGAA